MNKRQVIKFPRIIAKGETLNTQKYENQDLELIKSEVVKITKAIPHLIDLINYYCTFEKGKIGIEGNYYFFNISMQDAKEYALDGVDRESYFRHELNKLYEKRLQFLLPFTDTLHLIDAIRINPIFKKSKDMIDKYRQGKLLKNKAIGFTVEFSKLLWGDIYNKRGGGGWFYTPVAFTAKLWDLCKLNGRSQNDYLRIRLFYLFIMLHNNNRGDYITISNPKELIRTCYKHLEKQKGYWQVKKAVDDDLKLIDQLSKCGLIEYNILRPASFWIDKTEIIIYLNTDYKKEIAYTGERKRRKK